MQILPFTHDNVSINFDSYHDGTSWKSSDAGSNFQIYKLSDSLQFRYAAGVSAGSEPTWAGAINIDSSGNIGINYSTPSSMSASANNLVVGSGTSGDNTGLTIFSNSDASGSLHFADGTSGAAAYAGYIYYTHSSDFMGFGTGGTQRIRLDSDGLKFGADTAAANALDDYEEGSWTPTFAGVAAVTIYGASYTKIGQLVMVEAYILGDTQNNTNQFQIGGLPYTSQNINVYGGGSIGYTYSQDFSDFGSPLIPNNSTYIYFHRLNGNQPSVTNAILYSRNSGNQYFLFQAIYSTT
jgi:hypothetical protein